MTTRKQAMDTLMAMAYRYKMKYRLHVMTEIPAPEAAGRYGIGSETVFTAVNLDSYDPRKDFRVAVGFSGRDPKIEVGMKWGSKYACLIVCPFDKKRDTDYRTKEVIGKTDGGAGLARMLLKDWQDAVGKEVRA